MSESMVRARPRFEIRYWVFLVSLLIAGVAVAWLFDASGRTEYSAPEQLLVALGSALPVILLAAVIGLFTFSQKKRAKTGVEKLLVPSLVFAAFWFLAGLGAASSAHRAAGEGDSPLADASMMFEAIIRGAVALALLWLFPAAVHRLGRLRGEGPAGPAG